MSRTEAFMNIGYKGCHAVSQSDPQNAGTVNEKISVSRNECTIGRSKWQEIEKHAHLYRVSLLSVLLTAFAEIVGRWNSGCELTVIINGVGSEADGGVKAAQQVVFRPMPGKCWLEVCRRTERQIEKMASRGKAAVSDMQHNTGEDSWNNRKASVVFSNSLSALNSFSAGKPGNALADCNENYDSGAVKLNVGLHCRVFEQDEGIGIVWEADEQYFPQYLSVAMLEAYYQLLNWLAGETWEMPVPDLLPDKQRAMRTKTNDTRAPVKDLCIHQEFFVHARRHPEREALLWTANTMRRSMTYGELADKALRLAALLVEKGIKTGETVAVTLLKGPAQVIAVLAVLAAGAVYVPIGVDQPEKRQRRICKIGRIRYLIADHTKAGMLDGQGEIAAISVDEADELLPLPQPVLVNPDELAYLIFTSGSTGEPKGVEITHKSAINTILDINARFSVNQFDRVFAVSALDFDLSVYDVFGLLSAGGAVVLPDEAVRREAPVWFDLIHQMQVTVWNSVPALMDMLLFAAGEKRLPDSLRLVLVSGDWVGLDIHGRLREKTQKCRLVALGGATEAAIWSNFFEIEFVRPSWKSIPYGKPLQNQCFRVVDRLGRDCPDMVVGELWIGGAGVARGYRGDPVLTNEKFIDIRNKRWYRTGDMGRYRPDGNIEFLGRADQQMKLRGFRIEPGEIETVLCQYPGISQAVATVADDGATKQLCAAVVAEPVPVLYSVAAVGPDAYPDELRDLSREIQSKVAEALMAEILNFAQLSGAVTENPRFMEVLPVADEYRPLLRMWLQWLETRQVIYRRQDRILPGPRIREALQYAENLKSDTAYFVHQHDPGFWRIGRRLFARLDIYRAILGGEVSPAILLDDELLSPESLALGDRGTIEGIRVIAENIRLLARTAGSSVRVALINGRSGMAAFKLLEMLDPQDIRFTFFDSQPAMMETARRRFSSLFHTVSCQKLPDGNVPAQLRYSFDAVLAINSLHRYREPQQGVAYASLMVRRGGKLFALEHSELTPFAAVTAAVLDRAFTDFDLTRRQACSPMLTAGQWENLFIKAGLYQVRSVSIKGSFTEFIEGTCPGSRTELDSADILTFAAKQLPPHMLPDRIEVLPWLPLSTNGKVDRVAVTAILTARVHANGGEEIYAGLEREIAEMWKTLLNIDTVGKEQEFFEIGGDSLLATRFLAGVKTEFGVDFSLRQLIESPSLFQVAAAIENKLADIKQQMELMEGGEI
ncbi:amino acid adenylation domain-containing protein [Sporomusa termitida]|uniref:D-alanine--poly(Phosphoribitol) ligase subunit 1 n=1 Tax=Sporomusa termitida TaxID=2377 RepID=A0A517DRF4_9FIRM|nr:amino acid adenylation domain-containing protein [Sporomusa termitida]QDR79897.1 D-alanine--poly(phosphoribitol) ligase subunit 1 [Sporomusa termitida]